MLKFLLGVLHQLVGNGRDMAVGAARSDHHLIGKGTFGIQREGNHAFGLGVLQTGQNQIQHRGR